ncbi:collectin-11-like [Drosophila elegans]|uniref:collectin-11-like n=1 Tax=Drosophila elegans TaxID=30023 RepID=UPI0007E66CA9|nr:collectin-11-like [Drosophila elegans]
MFKLAAVLFFLLAAVHGSNLAEHQHKAIEAENEWKSSLELRYQNLQNSMERQFSDIKEILRSIKASIITNNAPMVKCIPPNFELIGDRYFYIEEKETNWYDAQIKCKRNGGFLASIKNGQELSALSAKLDRGARYWLGINDRARKGDFLSATSGKNNSFLKWSPGEPDSWNDRMHCVGLKNGLMAMHLCENERHPICQADNEI